MTPSLVKKLFSLMNILPVFVMMPVLPGVPKLGVNSPPRFIIPEFINKPLLPKPRVSMVPLLLNVPLLLIPPRFSTRRKSPALMVPLLLNEPLLPIPPAFKLKPTSDRLPVPAIFKLLPSASCKPFAFPVVLSVTVLVPFRMQAFVEAVGVPLVQLPSRFQKLFPPFCHVVEGALRLPHWARACPAPKDRDSPSMSVDNSGREAPSEFRGRIVRSIAASHELIKDPSVMIKSCTSGLRRAEYN